MECICVALFWTVISSAIKEDNFTLKHLTPHAFASVLRYSGEDIWGCLNCLSLPIEWWLKMLKIYLSSDDSCAFPRNCFLILLFSILQCSFDILRSQFYFNATCVQNDVIKSSYEEWKAYEHFGAVILHSSSVSPPKFGRWFFCCYCWLLL